MGYFDQFIIPFAGLKPGEHSFSFDVTDEFFSKYNYSELSRGRIQVELILEKQERMLILNFDLVGTIEVMCDRCLDFYHQPVQGKQRLFIKFGEDFHEESDEIVVIPRSENKIEVGHYIFELIILLLPYRLVHPENEKGESVCDKDIIQKIEEYMPHHYMDPRWDALKKLKNKLEKE